MALLSDYMDGTFRLIECRNDGSFYASVNGGESWTKISGMTSAELQRLAALENESVKTVSINGNAQTRENGSVNLLLSTKSLSDVSSAEPADGNVLRWNSSSGRYEPSSAASVSSANGNAVTISFGTYGGDSTLDFGTYS